MAYHHFDHQERPDDRRTPQLVYKGPAPFLELNPLYDYPANLGKMREPTSELKPLSSSHYECALGGCRALHTLAYPA